MQRVTNSDEFKRTDRLAILEGRNAAMRLCIAVKARLPEEFLACHATYIVEASGEGSIAYAVKLDRAATMSPESVARLQSYAQAWLDCLGANAVYEHLASVEAVYESRFLREAIANVFRPVLAAEVLARLERAYVEAKLAAGVESVRLHDGLRVRSLTEYEMQCLGRFDPPGAEYVEKGSLEGTNSFSPLPAEVTRVDAQPGSGSEDQGPPPREGDLAKMAEFIIRNSDKVTPVRVVPPEISLTELGRTVHEDFWRKPSPEEPQRQEGEES